MEIKLVMDDEAVDVFAAALAKAMRPADAAPSGKGKTGGKKKPAAQAEAEADTGETDTGEDTGEADTGEATGEADTGEDFGEGVTEKAVSRDDVLAALKAVSSKIDQDTAMAILKKTGGASKLSALTEGKFAAVIKACNDAVAKKK